MNVEHNIEHTVEAHTPEPWQMTYSEFFDEFYRLMAAVGTNEKKGGLDPEAENYIPISAEEKKLLQHDWKAFSAGRGYTEEEIADYARWLVLNGRRDSLIHAYKYPWRNGATGPIPLPHILFIDHVEKALADGKEVPATTRQDYESICEQTKALPQTMHAPTADHSDGSCNNCDK